MSISYSNRHSFIYNHILYIYIISIYLSIYFTYVCTKTQLSSAVRRDRYSSYSSFASPPLVSIRNGTWRSIWAFSGTTHKTKNFFAQTTTTKTKDWTHKQQQQQKKQQRVAMLNCHRRGGDGKRGRQLGVGRGRQLNENPMRSQRQQQLPLYNMCECISNLC